MLTEFRWIQSHRVPTYSLGSWCTSTTRTMQDYCCMLDQEFYSVFKTQSRERNLFATKRNKE